MTSVFSTPIRTQRLEGEAESLARRLIRAEPSATAVLVVDQSGRVLAAEPSAEYPPTLSVAEEEVRRFGSLVGVLLGAGDRGAKYLGVMEHACYTFEQSRVLIFTVPNSGFSVAVQLERGADGDEAFARLAGAASRE